MWSNARLTTYITGLVGFGGLTLAGAGLVVDGISGSMRQRGSLIC